MIKEVKEQHQGIVYYYIEKFIEDAQLKGLIDQGDHFYIRNKILQLLDLSDFDETAVTTIKEGNAQKESYPIDGILSKEVLRRLAIETPFAKEQLETAIYDTISKKPSEVTAKFYQDIAMASTLATSNFYQYSQDIGYVKDVSKNITWQYKSKYGVIDMTINLAKPEKDPKDIAKQVTMRKQPEKSYPKCQLCLENVGYAGNLHIDPRQTLRSIPMELVNEPWYFQFSPYSYYPEHAILIKKEHTPMLINQITFQRLVEFAQRFPTYFIGSNAGIPVVGGSILNHEHYQAGQYLFPIMRAESFWQYDGLDEISYELLDWPVSTIRLKAKTGAALVAAMEHIRKSWETYENSSLNIIACSEKEIHNAVTPIVRMVDDLLEGYISLRNNRTNKTYPDGIFHVHPEMYHIKKENIGLIEVMGLAILPGRLKVELAEVENYLLGKKYNQEVMHKHRHWAEKLLVKYDFAFLSKSQRLDVLQKEVATVFVKGLECTGVFKKQEDMITFIEQILKT